MQQRPIRTIAWVGGRFFHAHLSACGIETHHVACEKPAALSWDDVVERAGCRPDMVVYADRSLPPPLVGLESFPCPTAFYCIDSHIHGWYPAYAQAFDLCVLSLKDDLPRFALRLDPAQLLWLPPVPADDAVPRDVAKEWDLLFVGKVDPETTPIRHAFLAELGRRFPGLVVRQGDFKSLFPKARLVLNIAERGDLNFRVFEALACGACLVTPRIAQGQEDLFTPGEHLFTYAPGDIPGLLALVRELLSDDARRERVARAGNALVEAKHRLRHRAETFADFLRDRPLERLVADRLANSAAIRERFLKLVFLHWAEEFRASELGPLYLKAAQGR